MRRLLVVSLMPVLFVLPSMAQGQYQEGPPPAAPAIGQYGRASYQSYGQQQQYPAQQPQVDPSVPGNSSLTPGEYVMTNRTTGQNMYVTVTPNGQMYTQDAPPQAAVSLPQQATASQAGADDQATAAQQQQPGQSKLSVVGGALKGALGMYYQYKYGNSMMGGYPYGGYGYPMGYGGYGYAPSGGGGFISNLMSRF